MPNDPESQHPGVYPKGRAKPQLHGICNNITYKRKSVQINCSTVGISLNKLSLRFLLKEKNKEEKEE